MATRRHYMARKGRGMRDTHLLQPWENRQHVPAAESNCRAEAGRKDARYIFGESSSGDMCHAEDAFARERLFRLED